MVYNYFATLDIILINGRKQNVTSGQSELEQLEARLRETEQRLKKVSRQNSPSRQADSGASYTGASKENTPFLSPSDNRPSPLSQKPVYPEDRPPAEGRPQNARGDTQEMMSGMPGAMPDDSEQSNGRDDYVMVDNRRGR